MTRALRFLAKDNETGNQATNIWLGLELCAGELFTQNSMRDDNEILEMINSTLSKSSNSSGGKK